MANYSSNGYSIKIRRKKRRKKEKKKISKPLLFLLAVVSALAILSNYALKNSETLISTFNAFKLKNVKVTEPVYAEGIKIDSVNVGGLTYDQAKQLLESKINTDTSGNAVTVKSTDGSKCYNYSFENFGIDFHLDRALKDAMEFGTVEEEYAYDYNAVKNGSVNFSVYSYNRPKIDSYIRAIGTQNAAEPKNATCTKGSDGFDIQPETVGYSVDAEIILKKVIELMNARKFGQEVQFEINTVKPEITAADFEYITNQLSSYASPYSGGDENRIHNLRVGCEKIDGSIVMPDEVFSTNNAFNPCTEENGWKSAGTIVGGKLEDSVGGGMCQVSSALYDAALYAELEIVERHNHSLKVGYAPYGFDATLAGDYLDLKFRNNTGYPIYIESYLTSENVVVKIYGHNRFSSSRSIELENKFIEDIPHGDYIIVNDPELPVGVEEIQVSQLTGKKYELYKKVYENGELIETVKINTSTYRPRDGEKHIGTKQSEKPADTGSDTEENNSAEENNESDNSSDSASESED